MDIENETAKQRSFLCVATVECKLAFKNNRTTGTVL